MQASRRGFLAGARRRDRRAGDREGRPHHARARHRHAVAEADRHGPATSSNTAASNTWRCKRTSHSVWLGVEWQNPRADYINPLASQENTIPVTPAAIPTQANGPSAAAEPPGMLSGRAQCRPLLRGLAGRHRARSRPAPAASGLALVKVPAVRDPVINCPAVVAGDTRMVGSAPYVCGGKRRHGPARAAWDMLRLRLRGRRHRDVAAAAPEGQGCPRRLSQGSNIEVARSRRREGGETAPAAGRRRARSGGVRLA